MITATIVNQKGGVCKTTICRNLGYLLAAKYHKKTLLIDLDSSGNLSNFFKLRPEGQICKGAAKILTDLDASPEENIVETRIPGLYLLPGNQALGAAEKDIKSDDLTPQQYRLKLQLQKIDKSFDYCLIDCPPTVTNSIIVINGLVSSDDVIIPCPANIDSLDGASAIVSMVNTIRKYYNSKINLRGIVFCRISRKTIDRNLLEEQLSIPRFRSYIRESSALAEYSLMEGKSFTEYDPKAKGTHDMENFAAEYVGVDFPYPEDLPKGLSEYM